MEERVSVVIPTYRRPRTLLRAVRSALAQTHAPLEVIVVSDGEDGETEAAVASLGGATGEGTRLRYVALAERQGGCAARNAGVEVSGGDWIALLDDDDEWYPEKLERQLRVARKGTGGDGGSGYPIVVCRAHVSRGIRDAIWPLRMPREGEDLSEYLFCRAGLGQGEGMIVTSMVLARRELLRAVPFRVGARRHQDSDWMLRTAKLDGAGIAWVWEPLLTFHLEAGTSSVSRSMDPMPSLEWAAWARAQGVMTRRAYGYFLATQVAPRLGLRTHAGIVGPLLREYLRGSEVTVHSSALLLLYLLSGQGMRNALLRAVRRDAGMRGRVDGG